MTGRDLDPYMGRAFLGDGLATIVAGYSGGTGVTTYAENIGVMAVTKIYSTIVFVVAALIAIALGFSPKFGALIQTIPGPVLGGVSVVVRRSRRRARRSGRQPGRLRQNRNLIVAAVTLVPRCSRSAAWRSVASRPPRSARSCSICCCANDAMSLRGPAARKGGGPDGLLAVLERAVGQAVQSPDPSQWTSRASCSHIARPIAPFTDPHCASALRSGCQRSDTDGDTDWTNATGGADTSPRPSSMTDSWGSRHRLAADVRARRRRRGG
jgi:hypothetical protein